MYKYIGKSDVSFENGNIYQAKIIHDKVFGAMYSIKDESGEWYCYGLDFFKDNFIEIV